MCVSPLKCHVARTHRLLFTLTIICGASLLLARFCVCVCVHTHVGAPHMLGFCARLQSGAVRLGWVYVDADAGDSAACRAVSPPGRMGFLRPGFFFVRVRFVSFGRRKAMTLLRWQFSGCAKTHEQKNDAGKITILMAFGAHRLAR